jgi:hypothetical protein
MFASLLVEAVVCNRGRRSAEAGELAVFLKVDIYDSQVGMQSLVASCLITLVAGPV